MTARARKAWEGFKVKWSSLAIVGPLAYCSTDNHKSSLKELVQIIGFSTMTFWLSALILKGLSSNATSSYFDVLLSTMRSGELFIFTVAFMGPILIVAGEDPKGAKPFPGRGWHLFLLTVVAIVAGCFFAIIKVGEHTTGFLGLFDPDFVFHTSVWLAGVAVFLRYLAIVYRKNSFNPEKDFKRQEDAFSAQFEQRHGGEAS